MEALHKFLNKQVANFSVLFTKLHHHHWYVKGEGFFTLHELFEELYDEINEFYDEFAERLLTIDGHPIANMKGYLEVTSLAEVNKTLTSREMVEDVYNDFKLIVAELKEGMVIAGEVDDEVTIDLLVSTSAVLEKHAWMLKFYNAK